MGKIKLITAPTSELISLTDAKAYIRVETDADDALISSLITLAREYAEGITNQSLAQKTLEYSLKAFPDEDFIPLPKPPVVSITSIKYIDSSETEQTFDSAKYTLSTYGVEHLIYLKHGYSWASTTFRYYDAVLVRYAAGYTASTLPATHRHAILMLVSHWYETRCLVGNVTNEVAMTVSALLAQKRLLPT
jgi:uncharacterized phiE125 gp8 family phage protein